MGDSCARISLLLLCAFVSLCIGQEAPEEWNAYLDVQYGESENDESTRLDIYAPPDAEDAPVIVYVHGGAWEFGDKRYVYDKPSFFVSQGFVFVSVNHRLSPATTHPIHAQDVARAIAWVHAHIGEYGGDSDALFLIGHSTGAHLVSLVSTDEHFLENAGLSLSAIRGTVSLDCDYFDIPLSTTQDADVLPLLHEVFGDASLWPDASPVTHVERGKDIPPFLIIYVDSRREMTGVQALRMKERLESEGISVVLFEAPHKTHASLDRDIGAPYDEPTQKIMDFLLGLLTSPFPAMKNGPSPQSFLPTRRIFPLSSHVL